MEPLMAFVQGHLARRPAMTPQDVYKLLYQGLRGPEHLLASPKVFAERLQAEWEASEAAEDDALFESIRPDGALLRLNLRPYKAAGGDMHLLLAACLQTGQRAWGTQAELQQTWQDWLVACQQNPGLATGDLAEFTTWLRANGFPAVHHSEAYRSLYRPAYRLVAADIQLRVGAT